MWREQSQIQDGGKEGEKREILAHSVYQVLFSKCFTYRREVFFFKVLQSWKLKFKEMELFKSPQPPPPRHVLMY